MSKPSVKQHLAAVRQLFDYLVTGMPKIEHSRINEYVRCPLAPLYCINNLKPSFKKTLGV